MKTREGLDTGFVMEPLTETAHLGHAARTRCFTTGGPKTKWEYSGGV